MEMTSPSEMPGTPGGIRVHILLFSVLRERLGTAEIDVTLVPGTDTAALLRQLGDSYPAIRSYDCVLRLAVNQQYVNGVVELADGDEVALITPVSGG